MPIEIRELVIKAFVDSKGDSKGKKKDSGYCDKSEMESAIQGNIDQFAEILKQEKER